MRRLIGRAGERLIGRLIGRAGERSRYVVIAELRPVEIRDDKPQDRGTPRKKGPNSEQECNRKVRDYLGVKKDLPEIVRGIQFIEI